MLSQADVWKEEQQKGISCFQKEITILSGVTLPPNTTLANETIWIKEVVQIGSSSILYRGRNRLGEVIAVKEFFPAHLVNRDLDGKTVVLHAPSCKKEYEQYKARFAMECEVTKKLVGQEGMITYQGESLEYGTWYLFLTWQEGVPYGLYLQHATKEEKIGCLRKVISLVEKLHQKGIIHGDLKPANIQIDSDGQPILLDFGNALYGIKSPPVLCASPAYAAPELKKKKTGTKKLDTYSLGMLIRFSFTRAEWGKFLRLFTALATCPIVTIRLGSLKLLDYGLRAALKNRNKQRRNKHGCNNTDKPNHAI